MLPMNLAKCFILLFSFIAFSSSCNELKKIEVTATNNFQSSTFAHPKGLETTQNPKLSAYVFERAKFQNLSDPQLFIQVMDWVASQWQHDGFNQAPHGMSSLEILKNVHERGERYRCVEYGKVMADILSAMGHYSRTVGLQSSDVAYGGWGKGHVAAEVWSNSLNKWVFFDPQFSIYAMNEGEYLNIYDIHLLKAKGKLEQIDFITTSKYASANNLDHAVAAKEYKLFLSNYLGFHVSSVFINGEYQNLYLMMESKAPALTFQGMGRTTQSLFTDSFDIAYPKLNQVVVSLSALPNENSNVQQIFKEYGIKTEEQYIDNMWRFAAKGEIAMSFNTNMKNFKSYQVKIGNGIWEQIDGEEFLWNLSLGENVFQVRSMSTSNVYGPTTFIEIMYY
ncbi:hypothetical protein [Agaribacter flavus]|uniref:Transglutaminase-like domain-containing protein n=1 Tax=Agaribacter flavus TaxID=1902781 RepID=A0ABV7FLL2_9ALTE